VTRRTVLGLLLLCLLASPALGDDVAKKQQVDAQIASLQGKLDATRAGEAALRGRISELSDRIGALAARLGDVSERLSTLEQDLALRRKRLTDLTRLYSLQTRHLKELRLQYSLAVRRLNERLVAIYESPVPTTLDLVLGSSSIDDVLEKVNFVTMIGKEDKQIAAQVERSKLMLAAERAHTRKLRTKVRGDERALAARAAQAREARDALMGAQTQLARSQAEQTANLSKLSAQDRALADEIASEQAASAQLAAAIRAAQAQDTPTSSGTTSTPSSAGLIWPVSGPITSPFGARWGRMHEGIDIGVPSGTPIHAAASGTVIYCGWETGYGNLVVLDNGNNLATAYAHQSSIAVSCGQHVDQGQTLGYVGCTGHCFGPHLHFEVRIGGAPVDPLGYL
jgi:murein DD-endopeptidase MepM/ murein hydrolase activator NlpD